MVTLKKEKGKKQFSFLFSTASSGMNSVAAVFLEDIVKKLKPDITDTQATWVSKGTGKNHWEIHTSLIKKEKFVID